ncbi:MAG: hypothetical protein ABIO94_05885 [Opitutaceae bacterium]
MTTPLRAGVGETAAACCGWRTPAAVFVFVVSFQLWLVAVAGTDIPFHDQWGIEGSWLFPKWNEGSLDAADLFTPFNEHRILWTHLLNLALFAANGQWDPLVELVAIAILRAGCAAGLVWIAGRRHPKREVVWIALAVAVAFLPHLAWHNVLWGIESHAYFALGFSLLALAWLGSTERVLWQTGAGLAAGAAALVAMGPGAIVPLPLLGLAGMQACESRKFDRAAWRLVWPAIILLVAGLALRVAVPEHAILHATNLRQFFTAAGRLLAWPHVGQPFAAIPLNVPLLVLVGSRLSGKRRAATGENFILLVGGWSVAIALATAWSRGGSEELIAGVPSRYVDFIVLLPLANLGAVVLLAGEAVVEWKSRARLFAATWGVFLLIGWVGLSSEVMRRIVLPRTADREAPIRLTRAFQQSDDAAVFAGQPRLLVPHPNPEAVRTVLNDPRMHGKLPPSLQPERPMGPLSRAARWLLRQ